MHSSDDECRACRKKEQPCIRPLRAELIVDGICRACRKNEQPNIRARLRGAAETEDIGVCNRDDALQSMTGTRELVRAGFGERLVEMFECRQYQTVQRSSYRFQSAACDSSTHCSS